MGLNTTTLIQPAEWSNYTSLTSYWLINDIIHKSPTDHLKYDYANVNDSIKYVSIATNSNKQLPLSASYIFNVSFDTSTELPNHIFKLYLRYMPDQFWDKVADDGGNIRVYDNNRQVPCDVVYIDKTFKQGIIFFKTDLSPTMDVTIHCSPFESSQPKPYNEYGRYKVWDNHYISLIMPYIENRADWSYDTTTSGTEITQYKYAIKNRHSIPLHNGVAYDGNYYYVIGDTFITKYDLNWNVVLTKTDIQDAINAKFGTSVNHIGDSSIINGKLYLPAEIYPSGPYDHQFIISFDVSTLEPLESIDISSAGREASGVCLGPDGYLYVTDYVNCASVPYFDFQGNHINDMVFSNTTYDQIQGIDYSTKFNRFIISVGNIHSIVSILSNGTQDQILYTEVNNNYTEGLSFKDDDILFTTLETALYELEYRNCVRLDKDYLRSYVPARTEWCMSIQMSHIDIKQQGILSYQYAKYGTTGYYRSTLVSDNSPAQISIWDSYNGWATAISAVSPVYGSKYFITYGYNNNTNERIVHVNDALVINSSYSTHIPTDTYKISTHNLIIGASNDYDTFEPSDIFVDQVLMKKTFYNETEANICYKNYITPDKFILSASIKHMNDTQFVLSNTTSVTAVDRTDLLLSAFYTDLSTAPVWDTSTGEPDAGYIKAWHDSINHNRLWPQVGKLPLSFNKHRQFSNWARYSFSNLTPTRVGLVFIANYDPNDSNHWPRFITFADNSILSIDFNQNQVIHERNFIRFTLNHNISLRGYLCIGIILGPNSGEMSVFDYEGKITNISGTYTGGETRILEWGNGSYAMGVTGDLLIYSDPTEETIWQAVKDMDDRWNPNL